VVQRGRRTRNPGGLRSNQRGRQARAARYSIPGCRVNPQVRFQFLVAVSPSPLQSPPPHTPPHSRSPLSLLYSPYLYVPPLSMGGRTIYGGEGKGVFCLLVSTGWLGPPAVASDFPLDLALSHAAAEGYSSLLHVDAPPRLSSTTIHEHHVHACVKQTRRRHDNTTADSGICDQWERDGPKTSMGDAQWTPRGDDQWSI